MSETKTETETWGSETETETETLGFETETETETSVPETETETETITSDIFPYLVRYFFPFLFVFKISSND